MLDRTDRVEDHGVASVETAPRVRSLLGAFLFSGDAVEKRVGVLLRGAEPTRPRQAAGRARNCLLLTSRPTIST